MTHTSIRAEIRELEGRVLSPGVVLALLAMVDVLSTLSFLAALD